MKKQLVWIAVCVAVGGLALRAAGAELTEEEQERWGKFRKQVKLIPHEVHGEILERPSFNEKDKGHYQVFGCTVNDGKFLWGACCVASEKAEIFQFEQQLPTVHVDTGGVRYHVGYIGDSEKSALVFAGKVVSGTEADYVAVVNLYEGPSPKIVVWLKTVKGKPVKADKAFKPELQASLEEFLIRLQKVAR